MMICIRQSMNRSVSEGKRFIFISCNGHLIIAISISNIRGENMKTYPYIHKPYLIKHVMLIIALVTQITLINATTYYVNRNQQNASDSNNGSVAMPWYTIQKAANTVQSGDSCIVIQGNYSERVTITTSGKSDNYIVFLGLNLPFTNGFHIKADFIEINGFEVADTPVVSTWSYESRSTGSGIFVEGKYNIISSNYIHDTGAIGIYLYIFPTLGSDDSDHTSFCHVLDNTITRAGFVGIQVQGQNHLIARNDISHIQMKNLGLDADGIRFFGKGHVFKSNYIHDIYLSEGNEDAHIDCFQTYSTAYDIVFDGNICDNPDYGMQGFMIEQVDGQVHDLTFINNVIMAQGCLININNKGYQGDMPNIIVYNNTFYRTGYWAIILRGCPNSYVYNNLFIDCGGHSREYLTHMDTYQPQVGYNSHYMTDGREPAGDPYPDDFWQIDPQVISIDQLNFRLQDTSPLIDAGKPFDMIEEDHDGFKRPNGATLDIGAFENGSVSPDSSDDPVTIIEDDKSSLPLTFILKQNYPNPFNPSTTIEFTTFHSTYIVLKIFDIHGREVDTLVSEILPAGTHRLKFDGRNLASGIYYYQLMANNSHLIKKMVYLK